jgi:hypothetical protein
VRPKEPTRRRPSRREVSDVHSLDRVMAPVLELDAGVHVSVSLSRTFISWHLTLA